MAAFHHSETAGPHFSSLFQSDKLTNYLFIFTIKLVGPTVTRLVQDPLVVVLVDNRQYILLFWTLTSPPLCLSSQFQASPSLFMIFMNLGKK